MSTGYPLVDFKDAIKALVITALNTISGEAPELLVARDIQEEGLVAAYPRLVTLLPPIDTAAQGNRLNDGVTQVGIWQWVLQFRIGVGGTDEDSIDEVGPVIHAVFLKLNGKELLADPIGAGCRLELVQYATFAGYVENEPVYTQTWQHWVSPLQWT